ncbi:terminase large subunit domain-containing protein [Micromonospora zamorensis]|uniref:terminase large subunit domain-containing protein n=1 Tax=Micromonospora zamorensis TaxID=709883 RepID=UPI00368AFCC4
MTAQFGAQRPQGYSCPTYLHSSGPEAIDLARAAGLVLDPWQEFVLTEALGEDARGRWAAFEVALVVGRQSGKGSLLEARILAGMLLFGEQLILWSAHEMKTAMEAFRRCEDLLNSSPELKRHVKAVHRSNGNEAIELHTGARLKFVARSKGSGRGFSADLIILDEAYALTAEQISALIPTLASRANPQVWYTSSPPLDGVTGEQLYALRERGLAGDATLAWFDWGVQGVDLDGLEGVDLDDVGLWAKTNPAFGIRISEEFISRERRTLSREDFARERLGIWPGRVTGSSGVIADELWRQQIDPDPGRPADIALAVQVNSKRTFTAIAAVGPRPDGTLQVSIVDYRPGTHWVVDRLVDLRDRWNPVAIAVQDKGPTGPLLLDLEKRGICPPEDPEQPQRGDLAVPWAAEVAVSYGLLLDAVHQHRLFHLDEAPLNTALASAKTRPLGGGTAWEFKNDEAAPLLAATFAHWAWVTLADRVGTDYDVADSFLQLGGDQDA